MAPSQLLMDVTNLQNILVSRATHEDANDFEYKELREKLLAHPAVKDLLPDFVHMCRDLGQFWAFIKKNVDQYQPRREFLWAAFRPVLEAIEKGVGAPVHDVATEALGKLDAKHVRDLWQKALKRSADDPEGAITAARTLVESVCKLILDAQSIAYEKDGDLSGLYKTTARSLKLAVDQHGEQVFKQILTGCASVVSGLASVRNSLGDAHGKGARPLKPAARHAQLAVNLAGTMSTFLLQTFEAHHGTALHGKEEPVF